MLIYQTHYELLPAGPVADLLGGAIAETRRWATRQLDAGPLARPPGRATDTDALEWLADALAVAAGGGAATLAEPAATLLAATTAAEELAAIDRALKPARLCPKSAAAILRGRMAPAWPLLRPPVAVAPLPPSVRMATAQAARAGLRRATHQTRRLIELEGPIFCPLRPSEGGLPAALLRGEPPPPECAAPRPVELPGAAAAPLSSVPELQKPPWAGGTEPLPPPVLRTLIAASLRRPPPAATDNCAPAASAPPEMEAPILKAALAMAIACNGATAAGGDAWAALCDAAQPDGGEPADDPFPTPLCTERWHLINLAGALAAGDGGDGQTPEAIVRRATRALIAGAATTAAAATEPPVLADGDAAMFRTHGDCASRAAALSTLRLAAQLVPPQPPATTFLQRARREAALLREASNGTDSSSAAPAWEARLLAAGRRAAAAPGLDALLAADGREADDGTLRLPLPDASRLPNV